VLGAGEKIGIPPCNPLSEYLGDVVRLRDLQARNTSCACVAHTRARWRINRVPVIARRLLDDSAVCDTCAPTTRTA
jgi:hypothetical protein